MENRGEMKRNKLLRHDNPHYKQQKNQNKNIPKRNEPLPLHTATIRTPLRNDKGARLQCNKKIQKTKYRQKGLRRNGETVVSTTLRSRMGKTTTL